MEYRFSEQQQMLKHALHSLLKKEMPIEKFSEAAEKKTGFSKEAWKKLAENGWLGVLAKGELQTLEDVCPLDLMYLTESFGERPFPGPYSLAAGFIVPFLSRLNLTDTQRNLLIQFISGEKLITAALPKFEKSKNIIEFNWPEIDILKEESGRIQFSGKIKHIQFIQHADAVLLPFVNKSKGISVALLNTELNGVKVISDNSVDLSKPQGTLELDGIWLDKNDFIEGADWDAQELLNKQLADYLICLNGEMIGGADEVLKKTINYVKERKQFGVRVGSFQAVKHLLADLHVGIEKARSYSVYAASQTGNNPSETLLNVITSRHFTADMYKKVCENAIQLHGGMGFTWEESIHYWYKASMYQLSHITQPAMMTEFILQNLLFKSEYSKELQYNSPE
ncbi:acyl-CoA dehydrogenase family protein [Cytobacillus sp. NJ13]|nr:acyl-CoA dehydrogenase family protein [Cytobacillus sp. NJ13]